VSPPSSLRRKGGPYRASAGSWPPRSPRRWSGCCAATSRRSTIGTVGGRQEHDLCRCGHGRRRRPQIRLRLPRVRAGSVGRVRRGLGLAGPHPVGLPVPMAEGGGTGITTMPLGPGLGEPSLKAERGKPRSHRAKRVSRHVKKLRTGQVQQPGERLHRPLRATAPGR